jgi:hypothetical protein
MKKMEGNREEVVLIKQARCQTILMERKKIVKQGEAWVDGKMAAMASFGGVGQKHPVLSLRPAPNIFQYRLRLRKP